MNNGNQQAFPAAFEYSQKWGGDAVQETGLTKRELLAAMAMQGFISNGSYYLGYKSYQETASEAVGLADALLAELAKPQQP